MLINKKQLKNIQVETKAGQSLGKIVDFEIETNIGVIEKYYVSTKIVITGLFENKLIINKDQIISFDNKKMVVDDNVIKAEIKEEVLPKVEKFEGTEPVITSKGN